MEPISDRIFDPVYAPAEAKEVKAQDAADKVQDRPQRPAADTYVSQKRQEPAGLYWLGQDEDGKPKIYFDNPEREVDAQKDDRKADVPERKSAADKAERCTGSTDGVDREIEKLKKQREDLERQIRFATDDTKIADLEKKLAQVENELRQKDNDTYRRQHTVFS